MNSVQPTQPNNATAEQPAIILDKAISCKITPPQKKPLTFGQRLADKLASKVGSWGFLIGQSTILAGWITCNSIPGLPHWDESPFILLNLVFSFASAYTAPVVLMSQNRQSEEDRENASHNYQVTLQAAQNLELLHEKLDADYSKKLDELAALIKQQASNEVKVVFVPVSNGTHPEYQASTIAPLPVHIAASKDTVFVNVSNGQSLASQLNLNNPEVVVGK